MTIETTEPIQPATVELAPLSEFKKRDLALADLAAKYKDLKINGINDKDGYKKCHAAEMELRKVRVSIENTRKELKAVALQYGKDVDSEARRLTAIVEPIENALANEKEKVDAEKERIKQASIEAMRARVRVRMDEFRALGVLPPFGYEDFTEEDYQVAYASAKLQKAQRDQAEAEEAKRKQEEADKLAAERAEWERQKKEQEASAAALRAEQDRIRQAQEAKAAELRAHEQRIAEQEAAQRRAAELESAKKAAAEQAVKDEQERQEQLRIRAENAQKEIAERRRQEEEAKQAELKRIEAEKPIREKITRTAKVVDDIAANLPYAHVMVLKALTRCASEIRKIANGPLE